MRWGERPREPRFRWGEATDEPNHGDLQIESKCLRKFGAFSLRLASTLAPPKTAPPACLQLFAGPDQVEDFSFERPVFNAFAEALAQRVLLNVEPFLRMVLAVAQAVMPATRLKLPLRPLALQCEFALPIGNPSLDRRVRKGSPLQQVGDFCRCVGERLRHSLVACA